MKTTTWRSRSSWPHEIELVSKLRDCVLVHMKNTDIIIAAVYIPPSDSIYFNDIYFNNLQLMIN